MPRLFVAVDLAEEARAVLAALAHPSPGVRWVAPANLHVTMRFLGTVPEPEVERMAAALATVAAARFELALAGLGVFPGRASRKPPRVLWAGVAPAAPLAALKAAIDGAIGPDPEAVERGFSPHVTIARLEESARRAVGELLDRERGLAGPPWPVAAFCLYESRTLPEGAVYTRLRSFPLG